MRTRKLFHHLRSTSIFSPEYFPALFLILALAGSAYGRPLRSSPQSASAPHPMDGFQAIMQAFDNFPIVALGEAHGRQQEADFIADLVRYPGFSNKVNDIVVECGNPLYQGTLDRYIAGESVPPAELRQVWRNTTGIGAWDSVVYERFFATVRAVNQALPASRRLRVLAADAPIDWSKARNLDDVIPFVEHRDSYFAAVVEKEVFAKGRHALLILGATHLQRRYPESAPPLGIDPSGNVEHRIEERHPGTTFVIIPVLDFGKRSTELEPRLSAWPKPAIAYLRGTWLGALDVHELPGMLIKRPDDKTTDSPFKLEDWADAYLYLGKVLTWAEPSSDANADQAYQRELERRRKIEGGP